MAASDYYGQYKPYDQLGRDGTIHSQQGGRREDAPLPPVPTSQPQRPFIETQPRISPIASPFDESTQSPSYYRNDNPFASDTSYPGSLQSLQKPQPDPFADQNAIPLQAQGSKSGIHGSEASPTHAADPENQLLRQNSDPRRRRRSTKPKGPWYKRKIAWFVWFMTTVHIIVFIAEIIRNATLTKSPIEIKPQFNPMIGPSPYVLINMGARYVPCMRNTRQVTDQTIQISFQCPNTTTDDADCTLSELCGFNGVPNPDPNEPSMDRKPEPNQWFRFVVPMFLHAGIIHIGFNLLLQLTMGRDMELTIGSLRFMLVYFSSGIFGFVLGGNFAAPAIASTGASGCLFGILALHLLDLLYNWNSRPKPFTDLLFIIADIAVSFVLGLLPGLDNFSHIGGFLMGLVLGICILHSPAALRERISRDEHVGTPYSPVPNSTDRAYDSAAVKEFARRPVGFFKGRKPLWWAWWLIRAGALLGVVVVFIVLLRNFYVFRTECGWCKHLSCLPVKNWCDYGTLQFTEDPNSNQARSIFGLDH